MRYQQIAEVSEELLATCDREPIHIPNAIQPHGALLVVEGQSGRIVRCSLNAKEFFGIAPEKLVSLGLADLIGDDQQSENLLAELRCDQPLATNSRREFAAGGAFSSLACEAHWLNSKYLILEVEFPSDDLELDNGSISNLPCLRTITEASDKGQGLLPVLDEIAKSIKNLTGYDRVMMYQLDDLGHGHIVSESKNESLEPFLGLHFPASDIPRQARELYLRNRVRMLSNVIYKPIGFIDRPAQSDLDEFDMSMCHLRSVSPVHVEYLHNMGVSATLVISIVVDNLLWGLIACHHYSPKHIDARHRNRCEELAHVISFAVQAAEQRQMRDSVESSQKLLSSLEDRVGRESDWLQKFLANGSFLLQQMESSGAILYDDLDQFSFGLVPYSGEVEKIRRLLLAKSHDGTGQTTSIASLHDSLENISSDFCGCYITSVSHQPPVQMIWFRKELRHTILWSGDPRKLVAHHETGARLSPRKSFEKWCQEVQGTSKSWTLQDRYRANAIAQFVSARKVEDSSRQKSRFLANMSHEIRTPMAAIMGYVDVLAEHQTEFELPTIFSESISTIRRNGEHLLQLINDILDLSKIESGKFSVERSLFSPGEMVANVESLMRPIANKKGISLRVFAPRPIPKQIVGDRLRLQQALINLVGNGLKFTDKGEVSVEIVFHKENPTSIEFVVKDSGCGMNPTEIKMIFRPFVQGDGSLTRKHGGTGLGLAISRQLVRMMGGDLSVRESIPALGSTFVARVETGLLGIADVEVFGQSNAEAYESVSREADSPLPLMDYRVLLAEDGVDNQRLLSLLLRKSGASVEVAENGQIAVETVQASHLKGSPFDVVLMDMQMPTMDGYQATIALRSLGFQMPVIALTAHAMTGDKEKCLEAGCDGYLTKPVNRTSLVEMIQTLTVPQSA